MLLKGSKTYKPSYEVMRVVQVAALAKMGFTYEDQQNMPSDLYDSLLIYSSEIGKYEEAEIKKTKNGRIKS
jgi:hypothetical protein